MVLQAVHDLLTDAYLAYGELARPLQVLLLVIATAILVSLAVWITKRAVLAAAHRSHRVDATLEGFARSVLNATGVIVVTLAILLAAGVPAAAIAGVLAVFGFVVGFAMQDTLGNLAAGVRRSTAHVGGAQLRPPGWSSRGGCPPSSATGMVWRATRIS
jgi:small-conductance mechanosensitive channel